MTLSGRNSSVKTLAISNITGNNNSKGLTLSGSGSSINTLKISNVDAGNTATGAEFTTNVSSDTSITVTDVSASGNNSNAYGIKLTSGWISTYALNTSQTSVSDISAKSEAFGIYSQDKFVGKATYVQNIKGTSIK